MQQYSVACVWPDALRWCEAILEGAAHAVCVVDSAVWVGGVLDDGGEALSTRHLCFGNHPHVQSAMSFPTESPHSQQSTGIGAASMHFTEPAHIQLEAKVTLTLIQFVVGPHLIIVGRVVACCHISA